MNEATANKLNGKGAAFLLDAIEAASDEESVSCIERWRDLRLVRGAFEPFKLMIPLTNDGTLQQQLAGMERWCSHFAQEERLTPVEASWLALGYTARQLGGCNLLVNNQNAAASASEAVRLQGMAHKILAPMGDRKGASVFEDLAEQISGATSENALGRCLKKARAAYYMETGMGAYEWSVIGGPNAFALFTRDDCDEAARRAERRGLQPEGLAAYTFPHEDLCYEVDETVLRLAANAYFNNEALLRAEAPEVFARLTEKTIFPALGHLLRDDQYVESLKIAKAANPSYDLTPKRAGWPKVNGKPLALDC